MVFHWGRKKYCSKLEDIIGSKEVSLNPNLGLDEEELLSLVSELELKSYEGSFRRRGGLEGMITTMWWGSAINDILNSPDCRSEKTLIISGLFNLGVALFDSIIDDFPKREKRHLSAMVQVMLDNADQSADSSIPNQNTTRELFLIQKLITKILCHLKRNYSRAHGKFLMNLISIMFKSEIGIQNTPHIAKQFPIVFLGALNNNYYNNIKYRQLYRELGLLINYWDDWKDITSDFLRLSPNIFLNENNPRLHITLKNAFIFYFGMKNPNHKAYECIVWKINNIMLIARELNKDVYNNTVSLLYYLFLGNPIKI